MGLDFTALNNIPLQGAKKGLKESLESVGENTAIQPKKSDTEQNRGLNVEAGSGALRRLESEKKEREQHRQVYATYQENMKRAGMLRTDITKGIETGEEPIAILLKAIECISLMTGDTIIYTQSKEAILAIYGWGLSQPAPLSIELEEAKQRLARLTRPELKDSPPDAQKRIERAVKSHRDLIETIEREIARTSKQS